MENTNRPRLNSYSLTRPEVAERLRIGAQRVYILMKNDPTFPLPERIGKLYRWNPEDIDNWERAKLAPVHEENKRRLELLNAPTPKKSKR